MENQKERVTGIGGIFFKARDPEKLAAWYQDNLGIQIENGCADFAWRNKEHPEKAGRTVWSLFPADSDHFGQDGKQFMINYRVAHLDRMLDQLQHNGVTIQKVEDYDYGRFAWVSDPEGHRIELWEPKGE